MKTLETIKHAKIEFFILIIMVPHVRLIDVLIRASKALSENEMILNMNIWGTHLKL